MDSSKNNRFNGLHLSVPIPSNPVPFDEAPQLSTKLMRIDDWQSHEFPFGFYGLDEQHVIRAARYRITDLKDGVGRIDPHSIKFDTDPFLPKNIGRFFTGSCAIGLDYWMPYALNATPIGLRVDFYNLADPLDGGFIEVGKNFHGMDFVTVAQNANPYKMLEMDLGKGIKTRCEETCDAIGDNPNLVKSFHLNFRRVPDYRKTMLGLHTELFATCTLEIGIHQKPHDRITKAQQANVGGANTAAEANDVQPAQDFYIKRWFIIADEDRENISLSEFPGEVRSKFKPQQTQQSAQ